MSLRINKRQIWLLIKFFSEEEHANNFLKGELYLNKLSFFRNQEESEDGRSDVTEATKMWLQPHDVEISLHIPKMGFTTKILSEDLAGPVSSSHADIDHLHVFCMYAIYTEEVFSDTEEERFRLVNALKSRLQIDNRCLKFGRFAVVVPAFLFLSQLQKQIQAQGYSFNAKLVKYYDEKTFTGVFVDSNVPFMKQLRFAYQNEFRLVLESKLIFDGPMTINIGTIANIAKTVASSELNNIFKTSVIE